MARRLDMITAAHHAFRSEIAAIHRAALGAARGEGGLDPTIERFWRMNEVLAWHAEGEEAEIFPAIESVAPDVAASYELDHRGLDTAFGALRAAVTVHDPLETARATAAFKFHLNLHLNKEEQHLYVLFEERLSESDQNQAVGAMAATDLERASGVHRVAVSADRRRRPREGAAVLAVSHAGRGFRPSTSTCEDLHRRGVRAGRGAHLRSAR